MSDLLNQLKRHEGTNRDAKGHHILYRDSADKIGFEGKKGKVTIGYGFNVDDRGMPEEVAQFWLAFEIERVKRELDEALPWWSNLDSVRRDVLVNLGFNLGVTTPVGEAKLLQFAHTLDLIKNGQYAAAADRLLTLPWAQQVGGRAVELTTMLRTGEWGK